MKKTTLKTRHLFGQKSKYAVALALCIIIKGIAYNNHVYAQSGERTIVDTNAPAKTNQAAEKSSISNPGTKDAVEDLETLETRLKEKVARVKLVNKYARKTEAKGKYYRRTRTGRLRSFTYDFQSGKFVCDPDHTDVSTDPKSDCSPPYEIHEMDAIRIKITNINPFIYSVNLYELQGDRISNENLTEGAMSRSLLLNFESLTPISVEKVGLASSTDNALLKQIQKSEKLKREIETLKQRLIDLQAKPIPQEDSNVSNTDANDQALVNATASIDAVQAELKIKDDELFDLNQNISAKRLSVDGLKGKEIELQTCLNELQENTSFINKLIDAYNSLLYLIHSPTNDIHTIQRNVHSTVPIDGPKLMEQYSQSSNAVIKKIGEAHLKLQELNALDTELANPTQGDNNSRYNSRSEIYNLIGQKIDAFEKEFKALNGSKLMGQIIFIQTMLNPAHFTIVYETHSIAENADYVKYNFEFKPNTILNNNLPQGVSPSNLELAFQIHEGAKFDISSGFVLDYGLVDPSFYYDRTSDPTGEKVYVRKNGDGGNVNPAIAIFFNGYKRTSTNFKLGGALGAGLSNNARFRLYAGPSLIVGRKERVIISGGISFGAVSRLADGYTENMELEDSPSLPTSVPTVLDRYKMGLYFGVGFNLTGKENKSFLEKLKFN